MKTRFLVGILLDFKSNLVTYWNYIYGIILFCAVAFLIWWAFEIMATMKKDPKTGKEQIMTFVIAAGFFFGIIYFLTDIVALFGVNVTVK